MPIPAVITDLNAVIASNSPAGGDPPGQGDDFLRAHAAFIRQNYDALTAGDALIRSDLASSASAALGDALVAVKLNVTGSTATTQHEVNARTVNVRDFGAATASSDAANKAALQAGISGLAAVGGSIVVPDDISIGHKVADKTTWPTFTGVTKPLQIVDRGPGNSYAGYPTSYDGAQTRIWCFTPQTSASLAFTASLSGGATSATLTGNWGSTTGPWSVTFSNGDVRAVTLTSAATTATWSGGLSSGATSTATVQYVGQHDGNTHWLRADWAPNYCVSNDQDLSGTRYATDNRRAYYTIFNEGIATWAIGQGTQSGATFTSEDLSNWMVQKYAATGDTLGAYVPILFERKTGRNGYGVGTNQPSAAHHFGPANASESLDVALFQSFDSTSKVNLQSTAGSSSRSYISNVSGDLRIGVQTGGDAIRVRQSDGFVCYGTAATFTYTHNMEGVRASNYVHQIINTSSSDGYVSKLVSAATQAATWNFLDCQSSSGSSTRLTIAGTGNVTNVNNSYGAISDMRLKQDIADAGSAWSDFKQFRFRKYRFKTDPKGSLQLGVIAQEIEKVSPGLVETTPDYREVTSVRKVARTRELYGFVAHTDGNRTWETREVVGRQEYESEEDYTELVPTGESTKQVKYSVLYAKACVVIQELMARVEALEARLSSAPK